MKDWRARVHPSFWRQVQPWGFDLNHEPYRWMAIWQAMAYVGLAIFAWSQHWLAVGAFVIVFGYISHPDRNARW